MPVGKWKSPRGDMHGLSNGKTRDSNYRHVIEAGDGLDNCSPNRLIVEEGINQ